MSFGSLPYDIAHLLGGAVLLMSFVLLYQRRLEAVIGAFAVQGALLAAAAFWQGFAQGAPHLYVTALLAFGAKALLIPLALRIALRRLGLHRTVETALGVGPSLLAAIALVGLSVLVVLPATAGQAQALTRENLALALSVVLLGMLMMIARRNAISQLIGLLSLENGLILAAIGVQGMPLVVELSTAALVLMLALVAGIFVFLLRDRLATLDTGDLARQRGEGEAP
ncbi:hydrogenase-4 component E [Falsiroseomonas selenitidurans]|uniref:Hydrogenase-4 component E n=1 Tax=Falsiroseomonas selenitidurans TaxID=2716335 RepID=A0ABX1E615_9PROT|nr:hydrogenase-4 component E [Falsiroseomonas selenitidurans]NKC32612.1 hydrogenase-4 component E [Falsiroseomonas selenitidurans]